MNNLRTNHRDRRAGSDRRDAKSLIFSPVRYTRGYQSDANNADNVSRAHLMRATDITSAIRRGEFTIDYQPRIAANGGAIAAMEALVRWHHPHLGLLDPDKFIPTAESSDAIIELGEWVLITSLKKLNAWINSGYEPGKIAVNISARQITDPAFADIVLQALSVSDVAGDRLELELTESAQIIDMPAAIRTMNKVSAAGVRFSIDDFGRGYASLDYLRQLPVEAVKIDQSFIQGVTTGLRDVTLLRALTTMIADIGLRVVAEGIENQDQLNALRDMACDELQGFVFSRPLTDHDAGHLLSTCPAYAV